MIPRSPFPKDDACTPAIKWRRTAPPEVIVRVRGKVQAAKDIKIYRTTLGKLSQEASLGRCWAWSSKPACAISYVASGFDSH